MSLAGRTVTRRHAGPWGGITVGILLCVVLGGCAPSLGLDDIRQLIIEELEARALPAPQPTDGTPGEQGSPGPEGASGDQGPPGDTGQSGSAGEDGRAGEPGADGEPGENGGAGLSCWDLSGDGFADPEEDVNGDGNFDAGDCQGDDGPPGPPGEDGEDGDPGPAGEDGRDGLSCWDLDGNVIGSLDEDVNGDGDFNALDCQGAPGEPGSDGDSGEDGEPGEPGAPGQDGEDGLSCWDLDGDGVGDPGEDVNLDGNFDALDCQGLPGDPGADGDPGEDGVTGEPGEAGPPGEDGQDGLSCWDTDGDGVGDPEEDVNNDGDFDAEDCQGPPGRIDPTEPPTPERLRVLPHIGTPPEFELHWTMPDGPVPVQFLTVYESGSSFTDPADATIAASMPGSAHFGVIKLYSDSGVRHFRVRAVSFTGVDGPLSSEYRVDTTSRIAFRADIDTDNIEELYVASAVPSQPPVKVSGTLASGSVTSSGWSPDSSRLAFIHRDVGLRFDLFMTPADGSQEPQKISGTLVENGSAFSFSWSPDGTRLAFRAIKDVFPVTELYVTQVDSAEEPVKISGTLGADGNVSDYA